MRVISAPASLADGPLEELRQWLAISTDADDPLLVNLLGAAHAMCERFTGLVPLKCEIRERFLASSLVHRLASRPIIELLDVTAMSSVYDRRLLQDADFVLELEEEGAARLELHRATDEPQVEIRFYAGLESEWSQLDQSLRHGIIRYAAHQYRERDTDGDENPPAAVAALWRPWRRLRL